MLKKLLLTLLITISINANAKDTVVIKSTTNRGETNIGDYWIAEDLNLAFQELGFNGEVDYRTEYHKQRQEEPILNIYMRGYTKFTPPFPQGKTLLYVYYPMSYNPTSKNKTPKQKLNSRQPMPQDSNLDDDFNNYDIIAVASSSYAKKLNDNGIKAIYIPQYTNPKKFYPNPKDEFKHDILFVGSNWHDRTSLRYAIESGFDVAVYGYNWQGYVPDEMYKAPYIANTELNQYYSSAKIVLNDHRPDMKEKGFINNRIYDVTATGTMVISDYMPEIKEAYGDSIPMYKNKEELKTLLNYYLNNESERKALAKKAQQITLEKFTNHAIAQQMLKAK